MEHKTLLKKWGFKERYYCSPWDDLSLKPSQLKFLKTWLADWSDSKPSGLLLVGSPKLTTAIYSKLIYELLESKRIKSYPLIFDAPTYFVEKESTALDNFYTANPIIITEPGLVKLTPFQTNQLYVALKTAESRDKTLILSSSIDVDTLASNVGDANFFLIAEACSVIEV